MAPAAAFSRVLDREVDRYASEEPAAAGRCHPGIATRSLLWLEHAELAPRRSPAQPTRCEPERAARALSPGQRGALEQLTRLGARVRPDFTRDELRSQFRLLARAHHPDRHPGCSDRDRSRLTAAFATLRTAYEILIAS